MHKQRLMHAGDAAVRLVWKFAVELEAVGACPSGPVG